jgi:signal transduction histidine kinase
VPPIRVDRHKVLQILINLIRNAKYALDDIERTDKKLIISISAPNERFVHIVVTDNGIGIPAENLTRVFAHGFTTREGGHGFGLHSGAIAARSMGGAITVASAGTGQGATFTLELPVASTASVI